MSKTIRIAIASDHAGVGEKAAVIRALGITPKTITRGPDYDVKDFGPSEQEGRVDYPAFAAKVARAVADGTVDLGILICGTGIGMSIAANKFPGIRAALAHNATTARLAREHNNANVLCLGARMLGRDLIIECVRAWLEAEFEERHQHRLDIIASIEAEM